MINLCRDADYRRALLSAELAIADSGFMVLLWKFFTGENVPRISGLEHVKRLLEHESVVQLTGGVSCFVNWHWPDDFCINHRFDKFHRKSKASELGNSNLAGNRGQCSGGQSGIGRRFDIDLEMVDCRRIGHDARSTCPRRNLSTPHGLRSRPNRHAARRFGKPCSQCGNSGALAVPSAKENGRTRGPAAVSIGPYSLGQQRLRSGPRW